MTPAQALSIADLRRMARRRLPRILYELIESGVEDEYGLERNRAAFRAWRLWPRYLGEIATRSQAMTLFGQNYAAPFGIAPTGFAALLRPGAEEMLAAAARDANIPVILSGASAAPVERIAEIAPAHLWYHLYPARDPSITRAILDRVAAAGISTLVLTVDNPVYPNRERDTRNGFRLPLRLRPGMLAEALTHPGWILDYLRTGGLPMMDTWARHAGSGKSASEVAAFFRSQSPTILTWDDVAALRDRWHGRFLLKGLQHPADARRAMAAGIDGIILSNHGGKAFDPLPSPLETLPIVRKAVGAAYPVLFDSGIRRGYEAMIARALGADFVFVGRATLYGVTAAGRAGADRAIEILRNEIDQGLALTGCARFADLDRSWLLPSPDTAPEAGVRADAWPLAPTTADIANTKRNIA